MDDTERRHSRGWVAFGVALLGLMILLCTCRDSRLIQEDLWAKGRVALESKDYDPTLLSFSGRDALLRGEVASEDIKTDMEQTIRGIRGVRQAGLKNELVVAAPSPEQSPELNVAISEGQVTLSGLVPTLTKAEIVAAAEQLYGNTSIVDNLQTADNVAAPLWMSSVLGLLPQLKNELPTASLSARDGELTLEGLASSEEIKTALGLAADNATDLKINNNIAVAAPVLKPAALTVLLQDGKATLSGIVPEATIAPAVEAAAQTVGAGNVINNLQAATDVEVPVWAPGLLGALPGLGKQTADLGLAVNDNVLTLSGQVDSPEKRESMAKTLQDAVGETLTIDNKLELVAASVPAQLRVKLAQDAVQLSGTLPQLTADRLLELSQGMSSTGSVVNQLTVDQNVTIPEWLPEVLEQLPQYVKDVAEAELNIQDTTITLVGSVPTEAQKTAVEATLREAAGNEPGIANQLRVVPVLVEPALSIRVQEDKVQLAGSVSQETATQIQAFLTAPNVENKLEVAENVASPAYVAQVIDALPAYIQDVKQAEIDLRDNQLTLGGIVPSEASKTEVTNRLSQAAGSTVQVVNNLQVVPPVPAQLQVRVIDGVAQIEGNVPTEMAAEVAEAVDSAPETTSVENQIASVLNVDVPGWLPAIVDVLPGVTADIKDADVNIVADTITLGGKVSSDEQKTTIGTQVSAAAGPEVKVINNLVVEPPPVAELKVTVTESGVEVSGNLPEEAVAPLMESILRLPASGVQDVVESVENQIASNPDVEVPVWLPGLVNVLPEVTSEVKNPDLAISGNTVTVGGVVATEEDKTSVVTQIAEAAGPEVDVVNNLVVEMPQIVELRIQTTEDGTVIQGNTEEGLQLANTLEPASGEVSSEVQVAPEVEAPTWLSSVVNILPTVTADIQNADIAIVDKTITLAGTVSTEAKKAEVANQIAEAATPEVDIINNLQVLEPALEPAEEVTAVEADPAASEIVAEDAVETAPPAGPLQQSEEPASEPVAEQTTTQQETAVAAEEIAEPSVTEEEPEVPGTAASEQGQESVVEEASDVPLTEASSEASQEGAEPAPASVEESAQEEPQAVTSEGVEPSVQGLEEDTIVAEPQPAEIVTEDAEQVEEPQGVTQESQVVETDVSQEAEVPVISEPERSQENVAEEVIAPVVEAVASEATTEPTTNLVAPVVLDAPAPVLPTPVVRIDVAGSEVRLTGSVPDPVSVDLADDGFENKTVVNALEASEVAAAPYLSSLFTVAPRVAGDLNRFSMVLEDKVLTLQGVASSSEQRDRIGDYVTEAMQPDITVINRLSVEAKIPFVEDGK